MARAPQRVRELSNGPASPGVHRMVAVDADEDAAVGAPWLAARRAADTA